VDIPSMVYNELGSNKKKQFSPGFGKKRRAKRNATKT